MLAGTIGSRPIGSDANRRARQYLVDRLRAYGFAVRVQEAEAQRGGTTAPVANIIATRPGRRAHAIALVSHYDSVPDGPGAADDALGVAVCLEAGRVLGERPQPNYALAVILTDGEEAGLMGAFAIVKDPIAGWVRAVLNFDAAGSARPGPLFQTGPDSRVLLDAWAGAAPRPAGSSYMAEVYKVLPNSTDLDVFASARLPGLNFAAVGNSYPYHTARDASDRLDPGLVSEMGENAVETVARLDDAEDLSDRTGARTIYQDIGGRWAVPFGATTASIFFAAAWCWFAPAYTDDRPLQASICYVSDASTGRARWQIASNEPAVHVGVNASVTGGWQSGAPPRSLGIPIADSLGPFVFYGPTAVREPVPLTVTGSLKRDRDGALIEIAAIPHEPALSASFTLPDGLMPEETNLAGTQPERSPFVARCVAVPPGGVTLGARIGSADAAKLESGGRDARAMLLVMRNGLPGARWPKLPGWLPQQHVVWQARTYFMLPVPLIVTEGRQ